MEGVLGVSIGEGVESVVCIGGGVGVGVIVGVEVGVVVGVVIMVGDVVVVGD